LTAGAAEGIIGARSFTKEDAMLPKDRIIVALDVPGIIEAKALVAELAPHVGYFKVGLELITAIGAPAAVALVKAAGGRVMVDAKFNDIPNTMAGAARSAAALGIDIFTVHASAGRSAVAAAVKAAPACVVAGVTVLTSMSEADCFDVFGCPVEDKVAEFEADLRHAGAGAIVCSPKDLPALSFRELTRITPGIRPTWAPSGDQKRAMTPLEAVRTGADLLVIGRPITAPPPGVGGPAEAAKRIADEIAIAGLDGQDVGET
jgi:orotidine-5'-phosphate decarboxylase